MAERDARLEENDTEEEKALEASDKVYNGLIDSNTEKEKEMLGKVEANQKQQEQVQQQQTNQTIKEINQQKEWAEKDYIKEQSGAYTDYVKQTNQHGVNAESMATNGLTNSGYSESSMVSMYNAYQNRYSVAREAFLRGVQNYDNQATQARIAHSAAMAEIASKALEQSLSITMQFVAQNNSILQAKAAAAREIDQNYWQREYQIMQKMQAEAELALQREQFAWQKQKYEEEKAAAKAASINKSSGGSSGSGTKTVTRYKNDGTVEKEVIGGVDTDSITALGYGPISADRLDELIRSGQVKEYEENGVLKYKRVGTVNQAPKSVYTSGYSSYAKENKSSEKSTTSPTPGSQEYYRSGGTWKEVWNKVKSWFK